MPPAFRWTTFDVTGRLPGNWRREIAAAAAGADFREFPRTPVLSREAADVGHISRGRLHASDLRRWLPWLYGLYRCDFLDMARAAWDASVTTADDDRYGIVLNVQRGTAMRFECHVDSNPLTGLLFCTDQMAGEGGELVFGHDRGAADIDAVEQGCSMIRPHAGHLIFFDGRDHPALREAAHVGLGAAHLSRHELLHRVLPGVDPAARAEQSSVQAGVTGRGGASRNMGRLGRPGPG